MLNKSGTISLSLVLLEISYAFRTALSLALCAFLNSGGIAKLSYKSAKELSGYLSRASRIACAAFFILAFCSGISLGQELL